MNLLLIFVVSGKWDTTEASQGKFNFAGLDYLVNWAQTNNKLVRGHTTVWYSQLPSWVSAINNKATLTSVIQTHVSTEIGRYAGKVLQWVSFYAHKREVRCLPFVRMSSTRCSMKAVDSAPQSSPPSSVRTLCALLLRQPGKPIQQRSSTSMTTSKKHLGVRVVQVALTTPQHC